MKQFLTIATIGVLAMLTFLSLVDPNSSLLLMASASEEYMYVRLSLVLILVSLLLYKPPRALGFRIGLAGVATLLAGSAVAMLATYSIQPFDALLFFEASILLSIEATELGVTRENPAWVRSTSKAIRTPKAKLQTAS